MEDREIPEERIRQDDRSVADSTLGTPFSRVPSILYWRGKKHSILKLPNIGAPSWVLYSPSNPTQFEKLTLKKEDDYYRYFQYYVGEERRERFLKLRTDTSYEYSLKLGFEIDGAFGEMDSGKWVDVNANRQLTKNQLELIGQEEGSETERFKRNPYTGVVKRFLIGEENDKPIVVAPKSPYELLIEEIQKYRTEKKVDQWNESGYTNWTQDSQAYGKGSEFLEQINKIPEYNECKEAIMKKAWGQIPVIEGYLPQEVWNELCKVYGITTDIMTKDEISETISVLSIDDQCDIEFVAAFLLPELHLYPKCLLMLCHYSSIRFCGPIKKDGQALSYITIGNILYISAKKKSVFKFQQAFHQFIGEKIVQFFGKNAPNFEVYWKSLNQPDFVYDATLKTAPEGVKGFLTFDGLLSYSNDVRDIHFALMKDPKTVLEHSDPIIAKKAQAYKHILSTLLPGSLDDKWWEKVQDYKDIWELATGTTEYFKEVNLKNSNEPGKKGKNKEKNE
jgi:hypothetical protein